MGVPGLKVLVPATPGDAYGLLKSAFNETGPVVFIDHKRLFSTAGEIPVGEGTVQLGSAVIRRPGTHVTIATFSYMTRIAVSSAERLAADGISCEILDLRSLAPLDMTAICESAMRTGTLLTIEEGQPTCGVGAEIIVRVHEAFPGIRTARIGALPAPVSSNPVLEAACLPNVDRVIEAVHRLLGRPQSG